MTDDVIEGKIEESQFRRAVMWLVGSRLAGTLIAQFFLVPSAVVIVGGGGVTQERIAAVVFEGR